MTALQKATGSIELIREQSVGHLVRRLRLSGAHWLSAPSTSWRIAGFGIFVIGVIVGARLEGLAVGLALVCFIVLTPLLILAGLFYEFQSDPERVLPSFKTLLVLMFLCWLALEIFALGTLTFAASNIARLILLVIMAGSIALVIFSHLLRTKSSAPPAE
jgi:ABC-type transport system involved in cytochrome c biogenesis permease subunit